MVSYPSSSGWCHRQLAIRRREREGETAVGKIVSRGRAYYERYLEINGRATAAAITLYGFLALFALCALAVAIVGILATGNDNVAEDIVNYLGVHGDAAKMVTDAVNTAQHSAKVASIVGIVGLIWVGSSFAVSVASAYNIAWGVPARISRERLLGLGWLAGAAILLALGGFATAGVSSLPALVVPLVLVLGLAVNTILWLWTSWVLPNRRVAWRVLLPGAIVGAVGLEALKLAGGYVVPILVRRSSAVYGTIGTVFALLAWLWVLGRLVVLVTVIESCSDEANALRAGSSGL